jgi:ubiquinone/menaquinone biosynthesis C-methylase UbiE
MRGSDRVREEYARRDRAIVDDRYATTNAFSLFYKQAMERALAHALGEAGLVPLAPRRILEVGCGTGRWLAALEGFGATRERLAGIDLVPERAEAAQERLPEAEIRTGCASALPWPDGSFDVVLQSMVFSSVLDADLREMIAGEMARVLASGGVVLWYDFVVDNPRNRAVQGVRKREVAALFPGFELRWRRAVLAPPLVRLLAPRAWLLAMALQSMRVVNTHAMASLTRAVSA